MKNKTIKIAKHRDSSLPLGKWVRLLTVAPMLSLTLAGPGALAEDYTNSTSIVASAQSISINNADAETLAQALTGIGQAKAQAIVEWRESNGPFTSLDQLEEVKGIGAATVAKNRDKLSL